MNYRRQREDFQFEEDALSKNAERVGEIFHEVSLQMNFLQSEPKGKNLKLKYYELFYTLSKSLADKENEEKFDISVCLFQAIYLKKMEKLKDDKTIFIIQKKELKDENYN